MINREELIQEADEILKERSELNKKYPTRRNKSNTLIVDFHELENKAGASLIKNQPLNQTERDIYTSLSVDSGVEGAVFSLDFDVITKNLTAKQSYVLQKRLDGHTQQEIADTMAISRKNLIKHLELIRKKVKKELFE